MRITLVSVLVDDQDRALRFYTEVLGFHKKFDLDMGGPRWITVTSADGPEGVELVLEPNLLDAARTYQRALYAQGIPATSFEVEDIQPVVRRLVEAGVCFATEPTEMAGTMVARFDDTCGNWIQLHQPLG